MQVPKVSMREMLRILWRRKALLIGVMDLLTTFAVVAVSQVTPRYRAETLVLIEQRESTVIDIESVISGLSLNSEGINSEVEIVRSRRLAERLVDAVGLADWPEFAPQRAAEPSRLNPLTHLPPAVRRVLGLRGQTDRAIDANLSERQLTVRDRAALVDRFLMTLDVAPLGRSFVIAVRFEAQDPELAALVTNTLGDLYIIDQLEAKFEATERATAWLNDRLASLRREVENSEGAVERYRTETGLIEGIKATLVAQQVSELSTQAVIVRAELAEAEARLGQILRLVERGGADTAVEVLNSVLIRTLKEQESQLLQREAELGTEYGPRHPTMVNIRAELDNLQGRIASEVNKIVENLKTEVNVARARVDALETDLRRLEARAGEANRAEVWLRALEREATASRPMFETFLNRFKETSDQDGLQQPDARVISYAAPPTWASYPKKKIIVALALVTSGLFGLALIFTIEHLDAGFRSSEQIEARPSPTRCANRRADARPRAGADRAWQPWREARGLRAAKADLGLRRLAAFAAHDADAVERRQPAPNRTDDVGCAGRGQDGDLGLAGAADRGHGPACAGHRLRHPAAAHALGVQCGQRRRPRRIHGRRGDAVRYRAQGRQVGPALHHRGPQHAEQHGAAAI